LKPEVVKLFLTFSVVVLKLITFGIQLFVIVDKVTQDEFNEI